MATSTQSSSMEVTKMMDVGRLCLKLAGRDAGKKCVIIEKLDNNFVLIDGETRRRKCNIHHLEPLKETLALKSKAGHTEVVAAFKKLGIELKETKPKQAKEKPQKARAQQSKQKPIVEEKKPAKKRNS